jgi:putative hydrolase of HD superfamily
MSLIAMLAPPSLSSKINVPHCIKMALVHDMAEALVGDITPMDGVKKDEKNRREETTIDYFTNRLLGKVNGGITAGKSWISGTNTRTARLWKASSCAILIRLS